VAEVDFNLPERRFVSSRNPTELNLILLHPQRLYHWKDWQKKSFRSGNSFY
jgi:hypothetical protein